MLLLLLLLLLETGYLDSPRLHQVLDLTHCLTGKVPAPARVSFGIEIWNLDIMSWTWPFAGKITTPSTRQCPSKSLQMLPSCYTTAHVPLQEFMGQKPRRPTKSYIARKDTRTDYRMRVLASTPALLGL
jgi:hypothetical protein